MDTLETYQESARKFWTRFLTKKNQVVDCPDAEALAAFKHNICDEWLARHLGQEKPKSMAALTSLMTRFCAGEDSWLARSNNLSKNAGSPDTKDRNGRSRRNKNKHRVNGDNTEDTAVNAGFRGSNPVSGKSHSKELLRVCPIWTKYSTACARYTAPPKSQLITPIGTVGYSSRQAS